MEQASPVAPWVEFKIVSVEDRDASIREGAYRAKDVDMASITPPGSKDCVERPVKDWFDNLAQQVEAGRFPREWLVAYRSSYEQWKETGEIPVDGTSVKNWAVASPSQIEMLLRLHIRTVEQLAQAPEEAIGRLGMGGRSLVEKAKAFVTQATSGMGKVAEENAALKEKVSSQETTIAEMGEQLRQLKAMVEMQQKAALAIGAGGESVVEQASSGTITANDLLDPPAITGLTKL